MEETTYIEQQVSRTNRNLLLVNGGFLAALLPFLGLMVVGGLLISGSRNHGAGGGMFGLGGPVDMSRPEVVRPADLVSTEHLASLLDRAVTLNDPTAEDLHFPVFDWMGRVRGANLPHTPPTYHISHLGGGYALLILPASATPGTVFTGVIRKLSQPDRGPASTVLMSRGGSEQLQPFVLDCLPSQGAGPKGAPVVMHPVGKPAEQSPVVLIFTLLLFGIPAWNVFKAVRRIRNRRTHPVFAKLAAYGPPMEVARHIDAERQLGVERIPPAELTQSWLMAPSFFGIEVVHLDHIVWMFPRKVLLNLIPVLTSLGIMDRQGKGHPVYAGMGQVERLMEHIARLRPWIITGYSPDLFAHYSKDRAGFVAEVDARRAQSLGNPHG